MKRAKKSVNKKVKNATKVEVDGIKFKSKLEAFTYRKLKEAGIDNFDYEKHKFILQGPIQYPYGSYVDGDEDTTSIRAITYTPDFVFLDANQRGWVIEAKGFPNDVWPVKWKMFKNHLCENGYAVTLFKANSQGNILKCIEIIKSKYYA